MARPERFELPTFWFVAKRSIQLGYGRNIHLSSTRPAQPNFICIASYRLLANWATGAIFICHQRVRLSQTLSVSQATACLANRATGAFYTYNTL